uniref:Reverse transcriptase domain-containing protein n=1 Tax=Lactuca sativa TaxID=4236 RepID=A0A9R1XJ76_LACSA|nr:hypothetical protein LSAT_V11C300106750 [Lactuca sativa]
MGNARFLEGEFSLEEIKNAVWACGGDKSLRPDGFTFKIFKRYWDLLRDDIWGLVKHFEAGVIGSVIDEVQSTYVEGRNILKGPLIVNELCSWSKNKKRKMLLFKADFNKAFDSMNWYFLDSIMDQ